VHAVNAKLEEVATRIAEATGLSVECPSDSNLRVSCHLERLPLAAALQAIAIGCGLCDWRRPNGSWVLTPEAASGAGYGTSAGRTIPLRYLRAREAIDLLPNFLLSYLYPDEESNAIVVTGPAWMGERVAADLAKLDTPSPEMVAEVVVVEYTSLRALSRSLGLALLTGEAASRFDSAFGEVDFQRLEALPAGWNAALSYQEASSTSRVRSRSTLRVLNGKRGRIFVGQQRNLVLEQLGSEYGGPASATLEQVDIGASLVVRPQLGEGEEMVLNLQVEVDSLSATDPITGLPIVSRRSVNSTLRAKEGDTILIAGLQTSEETRRDRAIPLLARLPLLGGLFRAPDRSEAVLRLAVFVTPHRVRDQAQDKGTAGND
jgi:type II secretory pathway component GspD/PulD (secretin)